MDTKIRKGRPPEGSEWRVLGFDAAGVVEAIGPEVENFKPVDAVFYAGSIARLRREDVIQFFLASASCPVSEPSLLIS